MGGVGKPTKLWDSTIGDAMDVRWRRGAKEHRPNVMSKDFVGDPLAELYEELIDSLNYIIAFRQEQGGPPGWKLLELEEGVLLSVAKSIQGHLKDRDRLVQLSSSSLSSTPPTSSGETSS